MKLLITLTFLIYIGGEHITDYLTSMLYARQNDTFNALLPRRCKEIARLVKENHGYVAASFDTERSKYGEFEFEAIEVMGLGAKESLNNMTNNSSKNTSGSGNTSAKKTSISPTFNWKKFFKKDASNNHTADPQKRKQLLAAEKEIRVASEYTLLDGSTVSLAADIERFHCTEVIFKPKLYEDCRKADSLINVIMKSILQLDSLVQTEICSNIILNGGTALLPGFIKRLKHELELSFTNANIDLSVSSSTTKGQNNGISIYLNTNTNNNGDSDDEGRNRSLMDMGFNQKSIFTNYNDKRLSTSFATAVSSAVRDQSSHNEASMKCYSAAYLGASARVCLSLTHAGAVESTDPTATRSSNSAGIFASNKDAKHVPIPTTNFILSSDYDDDDSNLQDILQNILDFT